MSVNEAPVLNLSDFISKVKTGGLARANRFGVVITPPRSLEVVRSPSRGRVINTDFTTRDLFLFCDSAQLPGLNFASTQARTFGEYREMPYEKLFDTVTLTFFVDNQMHVRRFWEGWLNVIQDPYTRHMSYYNDYVAPITIHVYDVQNLHRYAITLHEAYPKTVASMQLDSTSRDLLKISVTIQYKYFTTTFFGKPNNEQIEQAAIFSTSIGDVASQITAQTTSVPNDYMNAWDNYQESFNNLAVQQENQFNNPISSATPVGQEEPTTDPMAQWAAANPLDVSA